MKKMLKKALTLIMLSFIAIALVACGNQGTPSGNGEGEGTGEKHYKIGLSAMNMADSFMKTVSDSVEEAVLARGDEFVAVGAEADAAKQLSQIEDLVNQGIDALVLTPQDSSGILPALELCKDRGIPVFNFDSACDDRSMIVTHVATDNVDCGKVLGEYLTKDLGITEGKIITIYIDAVESVRSRSKGFYEAIKDANFELVEAIYNGELQAQVEDLISANQDAVVFYSTATTIGSVAAAIIEQYGLSDSMMLLTVDGAPNDKEAIRDGAIQAAAAQSPVSIGKQCAEYMYSYLDGNDVPAEYLIPSFVITKENVDQYGYDGWQ